ncbi:MAG: M48 family metallopeptidase [Kiritimatiellia bacterium]
MQKRFKYERIVLDYRLILERRKTISATVFPNQALVVKAPQHAAADRIDAFLRRKARWILKQQRYFARFKPKSEKEYVSGETFRYIGRGYKLLVRKTNGPERVSLQHGVLTVYSTAPKNRVHQEKLLNLWYKERAREYFPDRLQACASKYGLNIVPGLIIRPMTRRWGSFSRKTNRICLNSELIKASRRQIDYVLTHELCHISHPSHNKAFQKLLSERFPDWERVKSELEIKLLAA